MKFFTKKTIALAVLTTLSASGIAYAEATVYGIAHASYDLNSGNDSNDNVEIHNRNSRLGFKGSEDLGAGMKVVYKMEFGVDLTGNKGFSNRNQYVGLSSGMGTVLLGRHDTPMKMAQGKFDQFNDTIADMKTMVDGEDRIDNVLALISPSMGGMKAIVALVPGEGNTTAVDCTAAAPCDGPADGVSIAFTYDAKNLFVSLGNNSGDLLDDQTRLVATYNMDAMELGAIYSTTDFGTADDQVSMGFSFGMKMDSGKVKFQYIDATDMAGAAGADETRMDIGYDHTMSKSTTVYAMYDTFDTADKNAVSFGIKHKF